MGGAWWLSLPFWVECVVAYLVVCLLLYLSAFAWNAWLGRRHGPVDDDSIQLFDVFAQLSKLNRPVQPPTVWERMEQHPLGRCLLFVGYTLTAPLLVAALMVALPISLLAERWDWYRARKARRIDR